LLFALQRENYPPSRAEGRKPQVADKAADKTLVPRGTRVPGEGTI
jgi:hypothetical protein